MTDFYGSLPFSEQIAFFRRKLNVPTEAWTDVYAAQHDTMFMVAGANRDDLVADFRDAVDKVIADGGTLEQFRQDFDRIVAKHGWDYNGGREWRSRVIYETNLFSSYQAGRYQQLMEIRETHPYWMYLHADWVEDPREEHLGWNGLILRWDDPWWETHFPINAWGCKCSVRPLTEADLKRMGRTVSSAPPEELEERIIGQRSPGGPRTVVVPRGIDPGFEYAPGASMTELVQSTLGKTTRLAAAPAAFSVAQLLSRTAAQEALEQGFEQFLQEVVADGLPRNRWTLAGALTESLVQQLTARGIEPATAAIVVRDAEALHALRDSKAGRLTKDGLPTGLTTAELGRLPALLRQPAAVLLDRAAGTLIYVFKAERREAGWTAVQVNYRLKMAEGKSVVNSFRSATLGDMADVESSLKAGKLELLDGKL